MTIQLCKNEMLLCAYGANHAREICKEGVCTCFCFYQFGDIVEDHSSLRFMLQKNWGIIIRFGELKWSKNLNSGKPDFKCHRMLRYLIQRSVHQGIYIEIRKTVNNTKIVNPVCWNHTYSGGISSEEEDSLLVVVLF